MEISLDTLLSSKQHVIDTIIEGHNDYCAEPHQLSYDDMLNYIDYDGIYEAFETQFNIKLSDADKKELKEYVEEYYSEAFYDDPTAFYI